MQTPSTEDRKDRSAKLCMAYQVSIVKVHCNEKQSLKMCLSKVKKPGSRSSREGKGTVRLCPSFNDIIPVLASKTISNMSHSQMLGKFEYTLPAKF